jgi:2-phospho-L-lactate guanylyltransferase
MRYLLIPVKDLTRAKGRLSPVMTEEERTRLAWALFERTCGEAARSRAADRVAIVTLYAPAAALAARWGFEVIGEQRQISESDSVDFGSREAEARGAAAVLRLPIDLPGVMASDIDAIFARDGGERGALIVPSRDGTGTNALLRRPPSLFPSRFGPNSLRRHLREAAAAGARCDLIAVERIALDLDQADDLRALLDAGVRNEIYDLLAAMGVFERL